MSRRWKVAVVKETSKPMLGGHGLHVAFRGLPGVEMVALVDSNTGNLDKGMEQTRARRHYTTSAAMLERESPDIVVLCSRHPEDHLEQVRTIAESGAHIFCEKPVSALLSEADEMVRLAEENRIRFAVAHLARYDLAFLTMKQRIESGEIGVPQTVVGRGKCDHRGGGEDLIALGTHILDLQTFFFGSPSQVMAHVLTDGRPSRLEDVAQKRLVEPVGPAVGEELFAKLQFPCGVGGVFESRSWLFDKDAAWRSPDHRLRHMGLSVVGTKGELSLRFDDCAFSRMPLLVSRNSSYPVNEANFEEVPLTESRSIPGAQPLEEALCGQKDVPRARWFLEAGRFAAWDLIQAIEECRHPISNIHTARVALEIIHGIYASHLSGNAVNFPLTDRRHPLLPLL